MDTLGAFRTWENPSKNLTERGQILSILKINSRSINQESGEI